MQQIERGLPATVGYVFERDGQPADPAPDSAVVTITAQDGTVIVNAGIADDDGTGAFIYELPPADNTRLGVLTLDWTAEFDGYAQTKRTYLQVVGGFYFSVGEFRNRYSDDAAAAALTFDQIADARATAEEIIEGLDAEEGCHQAFVLRSETFDLPGAHRMTIPRYRVRSVDAVTVDGENEDPELLWLDGNSVCGVRARGPVLVTVTHGWDAPPTRIKDAAILLAYHRAAKGPIDDRAIGRVSPDGTLINLSTPGMRGAVTGIPEVDAAIRAYQKPRIRPTSVFAGEPDDRPPGNWRMGVWP